MTDEEFYELIKKSKKTHYFNKYIKYPLTWIFRAIKASYLCLRFPFLYPRNCWNEKHWESYKLHNYWWKNFDKAYKYDENHNKVVINKWWHIKLIYVEKLNNFLQIFHFIPTSSYYNDIPYGWRKCFGIQMCKEIKQALLRNGGRKALHRYRINQIKEKFASLCWYDSYGCEEVNKIIYKYAYISEHTCINCGKPADYMTKGWICPYCKDCLSDEQKEHADKFFDDMSFYGVTSMKYYEKQKKKKEENKENDNSTNEE